MNLVFITGMYRDGTVNKTLKKHIKKVMESFHALINSGPATPDSYLWG